MSKGLNVHSEIGALKKVCVHRPGLDLVNMKAEDFERVWIHDAFYLEYAQREHDEFTNLLRGAGAEVVYMEDLLAETFDQVEGSRAEFMSKFVPEAKIENLHFVRQSWRSSTPSRTTKSLSLPLWAASTYAISRSRM